MESLLTTIGENRELLTMEGLCSQFLGKPRLFVAYSTVNTFLSYSQFL